MGSNKLRVQYGPRAPCVNQKLALTLTVLSRVSKLAGLAAILPMVTVKGSHFASLPGLPCT
jgi:hypothetical protein